jgi:hypothetical protein
MTDLAPVFQVRDQHADKSRVQQETVVLGLAERIAVTAARHVWSNDAPRLGQSGC